MGFPRAAPRERYSPEQIAAVRSWQIEPVINVGLRANVSAAAAERRAVQHLDNTMEPLGRAVTVYRLGARSRYGAYRVGDCFRDRGFISTCKSVEALVTLEAVLCRFGASKDAMIIAVIEVPAGTRAIDINRVVVDEAFAWQHELLLARDLMFAVIERSARTLHLVVRT